MATATGVGRHTFEEFCRLLPDGQKGDLIDGVIYVALRIIPPPTSWRCGYSD
jgi:hypothetical protein